MARRMAALRAHLHGGASLAKVAADAGVSLRTVQRWLARYTANGPMGLARPLRPEAGTRTVNRRPKGTPYRRAKGTPFVEQRDGYDGRAVRAGCGVGRA